MDNFVTSTIGLFHLIASVLAIIFGTLTLFLKKGTKRHKSIGYVYVISMLLLLGSSFAIYRLFKTWGLFHYLSIVSLLVLFAGMIPVWRKKPQFRWKELHFSYMYWSVIGLYCATAAELSVRIPKSPFWGIVAFVTASISIAGGILLKKNHTKWQSLE